MKLPELKKKFTNRYVIRIVAGVLTIAMVGTGVSVYSAQSGTQTVENVQLAAKDSTDLDLADMLKDNVSVSEKEIGKDETVYLISDATGNVTKTIVSDHLVNKDNAATLKDKSTLKDIQNVKGDEEFTQSGDDVTWQADGSDIYYQGTSTESAPVSMKVTYKLDGKDITPEELAGKSGKVTIHYDYTNNSKFTETVNGEEMTVCVPFAAITGMVLDDSFTNVEVTNGKIQTSGNKNIVIGYALPGLMDSLKISDSDLTADVTVPESFEVTADVENFSLETAMTVVANAGNFVSTDGSSDLSSVDEMINTLSDASKQLQDGSAELASGLDTLKGSLGEFATGMNTLASGLKTYTDGTKTVNDGATQLADGSAKIAKGSETLASGLKTLDATVNGKSGLVNGLKTLLGGLESSKAETQKEANALFTSQDDAAEKVKAAVESNVYSYVTPWTKYENNGRGIMDVQTTAQAFGEKISAPMDMTKIGLLVSSGAMTTEQVGGLVNSLTPTLSSVAGKLTQSYIEFNEDDGKYTFAESQQKSMLTNYGTAKTELDGICNTLDTTAENMMSAAIAYSADSSKSSAYKTAAEELTSKSAQLKMVSETLTASATKLQTAISDFNSSNVEWQSALSKMTPNIQASIKQATTYAGYVGAVEAIGTIQAQLASNGMTADVLDQLGAGVKQLTEGAVTLNGGAGDLKTGINTLAAGTNKLVANNDTLNSGASKLVDGTSQITDGVNKLDDGSHTLADGMVQFNEDGINKIVNAYTGDVKPLASRLQAVVDAGSDYQSYTAVADDVNGSVKFIYKLGAIKVADTE